MKEKLRVLLVEDNPGDARLIREMLKESRSAVFEMTCAEQLGEGMEVVGRKGADIVLLDLSLPDSHGLDTVRKFRAHAPCVPIIVLTGNDDRGYALDSVKNGAQDYLIKGRVDTDLLLRSISYAVERHQSHMQLERFVQIVQEREVNLRNIIENNADGIVIVDWHGAIKFANPSAERLFDKKADELVGRPFGFPVCKGEPAEVQIMRDKKKTATVEMRMESVEWEGEQCYLASLRDITLRKRTEEELRQSKEFIETVVDSMNDAIMIIDVHDYRILGVNSCFEKQLGRSRDEVIGKYCYGITHHRSSPCEYPGDGCPLATTAVTGRYAKVEHVHYIKGGKEMSVEVSAAPIKNEKGEVVKVIHITRDISDRKLAEERLEHLANYDSLTGLPNRTLFFDRMNQAMEHSRRNKDMMGLVYLDLDGFKLVNDTLGHDVGDMLLREVARRLRECVRKSDTIARMGGDEFTLILPEVNHERNVAMVARKILSALDRPFELDGHELFTSCSIGASIYPGDTDDTGQLLKNADMAMYHAKKEGKNKFRFYTESMNCAARERMSLENNLRRALEREEFILYYQPQLDLKNGGIIGVEALLRWNHPEHGIILPDQFIPLAEDTGIIIPLGEWVLHSACAQGRKWGDAGFTDLRIAVNLSAKQFKQKDLFSRISSVVSENGGGASCLDFEITESSAMHDIDHSISVLHELREMGAGISIDDFGTGLSSLSYLKSFPINSLKIDRTFVRDIVTSDDSSAITQAVIAMARSLGLKVVAEGVENRMQLDFLCEKECDAIQGYYFSTPVPADECTRLLSENMISAAGC